MSILSRIFQRNKDTQSDESDESFTTRDFFIIAAEQVGDTYYWYDRDTGQFLAQGKNDGEIVDHLKSRWPNGIFVVNSQYAIIGPDFDHLHEYDVVEQRI